MGILSYSVGPKDHKAKVWGLEEEGQCEYPDVFGYRIKSMIPGLWGEDGMERVEGSKSKTRLGAILPQGPRKWTISTTLSLGLLPSSTRK